MSRISYADYRETVIREGVQSGADASLMKASLDIEARLRLIDTHTDLGCEAGQHGDDREAARHRAARIKLITELREALQQSPRAREAHRMALERQEVRR